MKKQRVSKSASAPAGALPLRESEIERSAEMLKALANPARLRLVNLLVGGERTVTELCRLSGLKQSLVSQQLKNLRLNEIVERRREDSGVYYRLRDDNVITMLNCLNRCRCTHR